MSGGVDTVVLADDVASITGDVWSSMLGEELVRLPEETAAEVVVDDAVRATVSIQGAWDGYVAVEVTPGASVVITQTLLALDGSEEVADDDVADAVGEVVNMVGGNVKSLLPPVNTLSLPVVTLGGARVVTPESVEVCRVPFLWRDEPVVVVVRSVRARAGHHGEE